MFFSGIILIIIATVFLIYYRTHPLVYHPENDLSKIDSSPKNQKKNKILMSGKSRASRTELLQNKTSENLIQSLAGSVKKRGTAKLDVPEERKTELLNSMEQHETVQLNQDEEHETVLQIPGQKNASGVIEEPNMAKGRTILLPKNNSADAKVFMSQSSGNGRTVYLNSDDQIRKTELLVQEEKDNKI